MNVYFTNSKVNGLISIYYCVRWDFPVKLMLDEIFFNFVLHWWGGIYPLLWFRIIIEGFVLDDILLIDIFQFLAYYSWKNSHQPNFYLFAQICSYQTIITKKKSNEDGVWVNDRKISSGGNFSIISENEFEPFLFGFIIFVL